MLCVLGAVIIVSGCGTQRIGREPPIGTLLRLFAIGLVLSMLVFTVLLALKLDGHVDFSWCVCCVCSVQAIPS